VPPQRELFVIFLFWDVSSCHPTFTFTWWSVVCQNRASEELVIRGARAEWRWRHGYLDGHNYYKNSRDLSNHAAFFCGRK
jgi:hypothetical protein